MRALLLGGMAWTNQHQGLMAAGAVVCGVLALMVAP